MELLLTYPIGEAELPGITSVKDGSARLNSVGLRSADLSSLKQSKYVTSMLIHSMSEWLK